MNKTHRYIVIVENNAERAQKLEALVKEVNRRAEIINVDSVVEAYKIIRKKVVILLITGIEFGAERGQEYQGVRLIRQIRKHVMYQYLPIIAVANSQEYRKRAYFDFNCVGFFTEPFDENKFKNLVLRMISREEKSDENNEFSLRKDNVRYVVKVKDLRYVESYGRALHAHMRDGSVFEVPQKPIQYIIKQAKSKDLIRCSRGVLVNRKHIYNLNPVGKYMLLGDDTEIKIGSSFVKRVKEACGFS